MIGSSNQSTSKIVTPTPGAIDDGENRDASDDRLDGAGTLLGDAGEVGARELGDKLGKLAGELLRLENSPLDAELPALGELDSRTLDGAADEGLPGTLDGAPLDRLDDENSDAPLLTRLLALGPALGDDGEEAILEGLGDKLGTTLDTPRLEGLGDDRWLLMDE